MYDLLCRLRMSWKCVLICLAQIVYFLQSSYAPFILRDSLIESSCGGLFAVVRTLTGHKSNIRSLDFHPYGDFVASGSLDTNIKVCIIVCLIFIRIC